MLVRSNVYLGSVAAIAVAMSALAAQAAPVGVDGTIGAEWAGVTPVHINFDALAPNGNFAAPYAGSNTVGYNTYVRDDGTYYYVALQADSSTALGFANIYLGNPTHGAFLGFEVENNDAFTPGGASYSYASVPGMYGIVSADNFGPGGADTTVEFAVPNSFFSTNPLGVPNVDTYTAADPILQFRDSQSFGYTYAGGASYGPGRFGSASVATPEPASLGLVGAGAIGLLARRRPNV